MTPDIAGKIERSSLGTAEAVAARASVSDETAARIVAQANRLGQIEAVLRDHVVHAGSGAARYWVECLAVNCGWSEHDDGFLSDAMTAHRSHLASVIERLTTPVPTADTETTP